MAGPSFFSRSHICRSPGSLAISLLLHLLLFWNRPDAFSLKASGYVLRSPSESNLTTTPLANLIPQQPNLDSFNMTGALYNPSSNYISLSTLPPSCAMYNIPGGECSAVMVAMNVTYDDCRDTWTVCHCSTANMSLDDAIERLGKVPVGLRKYVATTLVLPGEETHAYTLTNGDLHMFGDCGAETWIHEATHCYDYAFGSPISGGQAWLDATSADSCATDQYGTTNVAEEFAQMSVLKTFSLIYGTLPSGWDTTCMSNQLAYLDTLPLYDRTTLFSNTCAASSPALDVSNNAGNRFIAVRPIKINGPPLNPDDPLRMDPNANPTVSRSPSDPTVPPSTQTPTTPASVAQDPGKEGTGSAETDRKESAALSRFINPLWGRQAFWCLLAAILVVLGL